MIKMGAFLILIFLSENIISQNAYGKGELTRSSQMLLDKFLFDADGLNSNESVIIFNFCNNDSCNVDTLVVYDNDVNSVFLHEERYSIYKGFNVIMKGFPDKNFFYMNFDNDLISETLERDKKVVKQINDSISKGLYKGVISFIPEKERHMVRFGIYKGNVILRTEYDPRVYYYVIYFNGRIINKIRSDLKLPNDYYWVR